MTYSAIEGSREGILLTWERCGKSRIETSSLESRVDNRHSPPTYLIRQFCSFKCFIFGCIACLEGFCLNSCCPVTMVINKTMRNEDMCTGHQLTFPILWKRAFYSICFTSQLQFPSPPSPPFHIHSSSASLQKRTHLDGPQPPMTCQVALRLGTSSSFKTR